MGANQAPTLGPRCAGEGMRPFPRETGEGVGGWGPTNPHPSPPPLRRGGKRDGGRFVPRYLPASAR